MTSRPSRDLPPREPGEVDRQGERPFERRHPLSRGLRAVIYACVLGTGVLGFMIAYSVFDIACARSGCGAIVPISWGLGGAAVAILGSAVVTVLLSRSFAEWHMQRKLMAKEDDLQEPGAS